MWGHMVSFALEPCGKQHTFPLSHWRQLHCQLIINIQPFVGSLIVAGAPELGPPEPTPLCHLA